MYKLLILVHNYINLKHSYESTTLLDYFEYNLDKDEIKEHWDMVYNDYPEDQKEQITMSDIFEYLIEYSEDELLHNKLKNCEIHKLYLIDEL